MHQLTQKMPETLALFEDRKPLSVEKMELDNIAGPKAADKFDPDIKAAHRIARQLQQKPRRGQITLESRQKGDQICEHLISALKNQPVQGNLIY